MNFSLKDLMAECSLHSKHVHERTISRYLNRHGFRFRQARKKGLLNVNDKRLRSSYARKMKVVLIQEPHFYTEHFAFYLDGVSFIHKNDPRKAAMQPKSRVWRKRGEGLSITAKGNKSLAGGKRLGGKRLFLMDNDPSQTSKKSLSALSDIECELHEIPPRSPDLNPIENVFHLVKKSLEREAINKNITRESFVEFRARVFRCFESLDVSMIDRTIESMPKRIEKIIKSKGNV